MNPPLHRNVRGAEPPAHPLYCLYTGVLVLRGLARGLAAIHAAGVAHLDIKLGNVLLTLGPKLDGRPTPRDVCVADFGHSRVVDGDGRFAVTHRCGTRGYIAPELFRTFSWPGGTHIAGAACDVWSMGVAMAEVFTGIPPCSFESPVLRMDEGLWGLLERGVEEWCRVGGEGWQATATLLTDLVQRCLVVDPEHRCSAQDAVATLEVVVAVVGQWVGDAAL